MLKYTARRLVYSVIILFFVMFLIYVLMSCMPSGYVETKARELASRPGATKSYAEWLEDLNAQYGRGYSGNSQPGNCLCVRQEGRAGKSCSGSDWSEICY